MKELRVLARGGLLVLDVAYAEAAPTRGRRAYVGRRAVSDWDLDKLPKGVPHHEHNNEFLEQGPVAIPHVAYPRRDTPSIVPNASYYRKVVQKGALWPADVDTAVACGVVFAPTFGGEYPAHASANKRGKDGDK